MTTLSNCFEPPRIDPARLGPILRVLAHIGIAIARTLGQRAQAGAPLDAVGKALERVAYTVRRIIMLALEIGAPAYHAPVCPPDRREARSNDGPERGEAQERTDWLDRPDVPYDLADKTMDAIVREICADLGLPPLDGTYPWTSMTPEAMAALVIDAAGVMLADGMKRRRRRGAWRPRSRPPVRGRGLRPLAPLVRDG